MTSPVHPVLIVNSRSGGGKAVRNDLVTECRARGIEAIPFEPGDDLAALAAAAIDDGADALGMAGGDGSQAAVAAVASEHDVPFVCVPAGTRNHFALDLGIDRDDMVGALDAFVDADERRIDIARVNGRVFVNNVALGLYGVVVQSPQYRDHKVRTAAQRLPYLLGPDAEPFDLRFRGPDGRTFETAVLVLVSDNPYVVDPRPGKGTRGDIAGGLIGVIAVTGPPPGGLAEWTTARFRVDSSAAVALGIDGESVVMEPPLLFASRPQALRVLASARRTVRPPVRRRRGRGKGPSTRRRDRQ
jgi:diacylglycerol kinase family enzyme